MGVNRKCKASTFRADCVDEMFWEWVKSFFSDPEALERGLAETQRERERENAPMRFAFHTWLLKTVSRCHTAQACGFVNQQGELPDFDTYD
jgi:hypothetical protein